MKLYVTRHGETPMNAAHRVCGLTNIDLTEKGIAQAKEAGRSLQDKGIKRIIASPLLRAQHTARLIADEIDIDDYELSSIQIISLTFFYCLSAPNGIIILY